MSRKDLREALKARSTENLRETEKFAMQQIKALQRETAKVQCLADSIRKELKRRKDEHA